jgi:hypothetical protein
MRASSRVKGMISRRLPDGLESGPSSATSRSMSSGDRPDWQSAAETWAQVTALMQESVFEDWLVA